MTVIGDDTITGDDTIIGDIDINIAQPAGVAEALNESSGACEIVRPGNVATTNERQQAPHS